MSQKIKSKNIVLVGMKGKTAKALTGKIFNKEINKGQSYQSQAVKESNLNGLNQSFDCSSQSIQQIKTQDIFQTYEKKYDSPQHFTEQKGTTAKLKSYGQSSRHQFQYDIPPEGQRVINLSFSQSYIVSKQDDSSFDVDMDEIMRQTDQKTLKNMITKSLEKNTQTRNKKELQKSQVGFSQQEMPKQISKNDLMPPKKTLNSSPKLSHRTLGKSFDFSSDKDVDEEKDRVDSLMQHQHSPLKYNEEKKNQIQNTTIQNRSLSHTRKKFRSRENLLVVNELLQSSDAFQFTEIVAAQRQISLVTETLVELDWQVTKAKHIISKYKDLVVKMQLQINRQDCKLEQLQSERDHYRKSAQELKDTLNMKLQNLQQSLQNQQTLKLQTVTEPLQNSNSPPVPAKWKTLLEEVNGTMQVQLIDMNKAKHVMFSMKADQQQLVEQLLSQLKVEQQMRLEGEEQYDEMMQRMLENQKHLETQIKMLKEKLSHINPSEEMTQTYN